jgi:hypothetical protein
MGEEGRINDESSSGQNLVRRAGGCGRDIYSLRREVYMSESRVARVTEVIAGSPASIDDAIERAFDRATKT